jgi:hypothetical protein
MAGIATMGEPILDDYEKELVRFFAQRYVAHKEFVNYSEFPRFDEVGERTINVARRRLKEAGLIEGMHTTQIKALATCVDLAKRWDNPPPEPLPDYRDKVTKWFWSKWWSLPVLILIVGLPVLVTWIGMIKTVLAWVGIAPVGNSK